MASHIYARHTVTQASSATLTIFKGLIRWQGCPQYATPEVIYALACEVLHNIFIQVVKQAVDCEVPV